MGEENQNQNTNTGTTNTTSSQFEDFNIFNEIKDASKAQQELNEEKRKKEKGALDYLGFFGTLIKIVDFVLLGAILLFGGYVWAQKNVGENNNNDSIPSVLCPFFVGNKNYSGNGNCKTIYRTFNVLDGKKKGYEEDIIKKINSDNESSNMIYNILLLSGDEVSEKEFIKNVSINKLKVLDMLGEFQRIKKGYITTSGQYTTTSDDDKDPNSDDDKDPNTPFSDIEKIKCDEVKIYVDEKKDKIMEVSCSAFSFEYEKIPSYTVKPPNRPEIRGRSISVALSFIDYLENSSNKLRIISKDDSFSESDADEEETSLKYPHKTSFKLVLKYDGDTLLF